MVRAPTRDCGAPGRHSGAVLKACLNGPLTLADHPGVPVTPAAIAQAAAEAVAAGADALHVHPKDSLGRDSLRAEHLDPVVRAIRAAAPGVPLGVTTGAWAEPLPATRAAHVTAWTELPDFASVNWHEEGAELVATALLGRGIGVEAGIWYPDAAAAFVASPLAGRCLRILVETTTDSAEEALVTAAAILDTVRPLGLPTLLHGEGGSAWPVYEYASALGLDRRIGLEDVQVLPDGSPAASNAHLVAAAVRPL